jgi:hypothetical protein
MKVVLKLMLVVSGLVLVGCGGGGSDTSSTSASANNLDESYVYQLKYEGKKEKTQLLTKKNIPIYLDALDISGIRSFVQTYVNLPYDIILAKGKDISEETKGSISGNQVIDIHIVNSEKIELTHTFNNYADENGTINGTIKDTVYFLNGEPSHTIIVDNLDVSYLNMHTIVEGVLTYSFKNGLVTKKFLIENITLHETLLYENFIADDRNVNPILYSGKICYSDEGCVELNTTYNKNAVNSDVMTMLGENNTAIVRKDYTKDFLVDVSIVDTSDKHTYLVYDSNITGNYVPLYESNISKLNRAFSKKQSKLDRLWMNRHIKIKDIDRDGKLDIAFTTFNTNESTKSLTVVYDAKSENNFTAMEYDFEYNNDNFVFADLNGDNKIDIASYGYNTTEIFTQQQDTTFNKNVFSTIWGDYRVYDNFDFNGDGKDDRAKLYGCSLEILTDIENENSKITIPLSACASFSGDPYYHNGINLRLADFNNDGNKDFLVVYEDERDPIYNGNTTYFIVLNNNDGTVTELNSIKIVDEGENLTKTRSFSLEKVITVDINKDGYDDLIINGHMFLNNKNNKFIQKSDLSTFDSLGGEEIVGILDVNKDGMNDIVFSGPLGIRAILIYSDYSSRDILLSADGDQRNALNLAIGNLDKDGTFDIVRNYNNIIEFITFQK